MSRDQDEGLSVDDGIRTLLLLIPRVVAVAKRLTVPEQLQSFSLAPRHLSLLAYLLFDGPLTVKALAARLEIAPTTVSLMVGELSKRGLLDRREDERDRRRTIVSIAEAQRVAVAEWLGKSADAWRLALEPLTPAERSTFVRTLRVYEDEISRR